MSDDDLQAAIAEIRAAVDPPTEREGAEVVFEAPWQARAFAVAVALRRNGDLDWERFQAHLVAELEGVDAGEEAAYYDAWLRAVESLLVGDGVIDRRELARRARAFERGERDTSEFVVGDHGHDHGHGHDDGHGHGHDHGHHDDDHGHGHDN